MRESIAMISPALLCPDQQKRLCFLPAEASGRSLNSEWSVHPDSHPSIAHLRFLISPPSTVPHGQTSSCSCPLQWHSHQRPGVERLPRQSPQQRWHQHRVRFHPHPGGEQCQPGGEDHQPRVHPDPGSRTPGDRGGERFLRQAWPGGEPQQAGQLGCRPRQPGAGRRRRWHRWWPMAVADAPDDQRRRDHQWQEGADGDPGDVDEPGKWDRRRQLRQRWQSHRRPQDLIAWLLRQVQPEAGPQIQGRLHLLQGQPGDLGPLLARRWWGEPRPGGGTAQGAGTGNPPGHEERHDGGLLHR